ncbi:hypothetical protein M513_01584 [Trichuris suis]|uniref:Uncharacterized protein n=1 Tax=Trichuris suis TaxID=68888 RepID=A0A085MJT5_9BILA|nr:hypothetical protein M513_01584 [Trichuris suis]
MNERSVRYQYYVKNRTVNSEIHLQSMLIVFVTDVRPPSVDGSSSLTAEQTTLTSLLSMVICTETLENV